MLLSVSAPATCEEVSLELEQELLFVDLRPPLGASILLYELKAAFLVEMSGRVVTLKRPKDSPNPHCWW